MGFKPMGALIYFRGSGSIRTDNLMGLGHHGFRTSWV